VLWLESQEWFCSTKYEPSSAKRAIAYYNCSNSFASKH
jgi:hypothetical protein